MKARLVILALASILLTGCVAAFVIGTTVGLVAYDRRSLSILESDTRIHHIIHKTIIRDTRFNESRILISSFNEIVLLVGQTPSAFLKNEAEKIAQDTAGVKRIYNEIAIRSPLPYAQRAKDTWITSQVRSLFLAEKGLKSGSIRIVTENGIVYLMGIVTHEQANIAVNVARQVDGVKKVIKVFQYIII